MFIENESRTMEVLKCVFPDKSSKLGRFRPDLTIKELCAIHDLNDCEVHGCEKLEKEDQPSKWTLLEQDLTISDVKEFGLKVIKFVRVHETVHDVDIVLGPGPSGANAFEIMMGPSKCYPDKRKTSAGVREGLNRKDEMFNDLVDLCKEKEWYLSSKYESSYIVQTLTNALWAVNDSRDTMQAAHEHNRLVKKIPGIFQAVRRGPSSSKKKKLSLSHSDLTQHCQALLKCCEKPQLQNRRLTSFKEALIELHDCFESYAKYLQQKNETTQAGQSSDHPTRQVSHDLVVDIREAVVREKVNPTLRELNEVLLRTPELETVNVDDHLDQTLTPMQRYRVLQSIDLECRAMVFRYCPGGNLKTILHACRIPSDYSGIDLTTAQGRILADLMPKFPQFHTRQMKKEFKQKASRIASVTPSFLEYIYENLTGDASTATNKEMRQRIEIAALGTESNVIVDLRKLSPGRQNDTYDVFWSKMAEYLNEKTAADERRHGVAHLSEVISLRDMMEKVTELCPDDTPVPTKALVRLQFSPTNKFTANALKFTGRFEVQRKVQVRQLRQSHPDAHFVAANFKYLRQRAVDLRLVARLVFLDDKAKVPIGEPEQHVSTGVRGKQVFAPAGSTLMAMDHDTSSKCKLTPSVALVPSIPEKASDSFYQGQVSVTLYDSTFEQSTAFQAAALLLREGREGDPKPVLFKYSDGGTEHRTNLLKVQLAMIAVFKLLNLDLLVCLRTAPGQSWSNPVERIMSILNLALQNVATARAQGSPELEREVKKCGSMSELRNKIGKNEELVRDWQDSLRETRDILESRFRRLELKGVPFIVHKPVNDEEIIAKLKDLFNLDPHTVSKASVPDEVVDWMTEHCRERHYSFQIRKCDDMSCCIPPITDASERQWLPDPQLDSSGEHYQPLSEVLGQTTTDTSRPGAQSSRKSDQQRKMPDNPFMDDDIERQKKNTDMFTIQRARQSVDCVECGKPRVVYSRKQLTAQQRLKMMEQLNEVGDTFTCGSYPVDPESPMASIVHCRLKLTCSDPVELAYYSSQFGRADICCVCASTGALINQDLKKQFKTVLPICAGCTEYGINTITARPYGKKTKK